MATTTKISKIIIRKGDLVSGQTPNLSAGEFYLAEDEQRLFLGQKALPLDGTAGGSDKVNATVTFSTLVGGDVTPLDLDEVKSYSIDVFDSVNNTTNTVASPSINDTVITFNHNFNSGSKDADETVANEMYKITSVGTTNFTAIGSADNNVGTVFTATGAGTGTGTALLLRAPVVADKFTLNYSKEITPHASERVSNRQHLRLPASSGSVVSTGIDFLSSVKNDISINYSIFEHSATPTYMRKGTLSILIAGNSTSSIEDKFTTIGSQLTDLEFSITNDNAGTFTLKYKTALTSDLNFNYTQNSSEFKHIT